MKEKNPLESHITTKIKSMSHLFYSHKPRLGHSSTIRQMTFLVIPKPGIHDLALFFFNFSIVHNNFQFIVLTQFFSSLWCCQSRLATGWMLIRFTISFTKNSLIIIHVVQNTLVRNLVVVLPVLWKRLNFQFHEYFS